MGVNIICYFFAMASFSQSVKYS